MPTPTNCPPYEFLWGVREVSYGVQVTTPVAGTDSIYIRLAGANRWTVRATRTTHKLQLGNGYAADGTSIPGKFAVAGNLQVELCYSQAKFLLDWCLTRSDGTSIPYTNSFGACDLTGVTWYHGIMRDDGTIKRTRYKGCKAQTAKLECTGENQIAMLTVGVLGQKHDGNPVDATSDPDMTAFPPPSGPSAYPTDVVMFFGSTLTANGGTIAHSNSAVHTWNNGLAPLYFNSAFLQSCRLRGRQSTLEYNHLLTTTPGWRTLHDNATPIDAQTVLSNTTHTITLNHHANNVVDPAPVDDLTPGQEYMQTVTLRNQWDPAAASDVDFTFT